MRLNGIVGAEIPYYKMMNKAMPGPAKDTKRKPKNGRLTEIDPKTNKPRLKSGVPISRAVEVLYMFENTDVLPYQQQYYLFFRSLLCFSLMYSVLIWTRTVDYMNVSGVRIELAPIVKRIAKYTRGIKRD